MITSHHSSVRADEVTSTLRFRFEIAKSQATDKQTAVVNCSCGFGVFRVCWVTSTQSGILHVCVRGEDGSRPLLLIPVEQCSFMVNLIPINDPSEKIVVGFSEPPKAND